MNDEFDSTVTKMLTNVENKTVNKEDGFDITILDDGNLSPIDNVYLILYATDDVDSAREFVGHIIKKFLKNNKNDMEKLKIFLGILLNAPNRLNERSFMHYFSINLVGNENKVELLKDLIILGGHIALNDVGEFEINKDVVDVDNIKNSLRKFVIENIINKKYKNQQIVKAVGESPMGKLPHELEEKILKQIEINIGGRKKKKRKSLKKKRKSKRRKSIKKKHRKTKKMKKNTKQIK